MQKWGLEWLWRIKEEPQLWRRYWDDGLALLRLVLTRVIPLIILRQWYSFKLGGKGQYLRVERADDHNSVILSIDGLATAQNIGNAVTPFLDAASEARSIVINFANTRLVDARFIGLLLMLNKVLRRQHLQLILAGVTPRIARLFRLNGFGFLLAGSSEKVA
jgi:N-acetylglucosaminyldiphosphoundecaprenol N-acetyl-beta-D-mannosaminyltransferase